MAEEKITLVDLRRTISKQMSLSEDKASRFLAVLFPAIIEGLQRDKLVRISGLGTFKLVWVEPRKSVNIQTGEDIMLDGYNKLTFIPESYIREQINEPYAGMEPIRVDENGQPLDPQSTQPGTDMFNILEQQANEIKGILADLGQETEEQEEPTPQHSETVTDSKKPAAPAKPKNKAKQKPTEKPAEQHIEKPVEEPIEQHVRKPVEEQPIEQPEPTRRFHGWLVALITIVVLLVMLVVGYFVLVNKLAEWADNLNQPAEEELFITPEEPTEMLEIEPLQPIDSDSLAIAEADTTCQEADATPKSTYQPTLLGIETVQSGSRLAQIARRYYNDPEKWRVIYEYNKDVIKDPNHLQSGTVLRIPSLPKE